MAARRKKCVICGEFIGVDEQSTPYKNRSAHTKCFELSMKVLNSNKKEKLQEKAEKAKRKSTAKPKAELKDGLTEEEYQKKKSYYNYLRTLIDGELSPKIYAVSENYLDKYKFTWESMKQTLVYLNEIMDYEFKGDVVGIIPYYHAEAEKYFETVQEAEKESENLKPSQMYQERIVYIKPRKNPVLQIDIESIGEEINDGEQ